MTSTLIAYGIHDKLPGSGEPGRRLFARRICIPEVIACAQNRSLEYLSTQVEIAPPIVFSVYQDGGAVDPAYKYRAMTEACWALSTRIATANGPVCAVAIWLFRTAARQPISWLRLKEALFPEERDYLNATTIPRVLRSTMWFGPQHGTHFIFRLRDVILRNVPSLYQPVICKQGRPDQERTRRILLPS